MSTKLHQIIAIEKGVKSRVYAFLTGAYKSFQKPSLFEGFIKTYEKKDEDSEDLPGEKALVQLNVEQMLQGIAEQATEYFDIVAAKDTANCQAFADVVVNGETILEQVPATYLLFLEKQLVDLQTAIESMPVLDPALDWKLDSAVSLHKSEPTRTHKSKKVQRPIVLYDATPEHPAQTQLITEDKIVGHWSTIKHSGALTAPRKKELQKRVRELVKAVKFAREAANETEAPKKEVGEKIFGYLFA